MSVIPAAESEKEGRGPHEVLADHPGYGLASITAGLARQCGLGVVRRPIDKDPAHAEVIGQKTKSASRKLAKGSKWEELPPLHLLER
jgi:hypothetical protein